MVTTSIGMLLTRIGQGIAGALVFAPGFALAGDIANQRDSGTKLSILAMSFGLGTALGPLMAGYLVRYGFITPFASGAVLATIGFGLVYTQVEETLPDGTKETSELHDDSEAGVSPTD
jgi:MFS family permease